MDPTPVARIIHSSFRGIVCVNSCILSVNRLGTGLESGACPRGFPVFRFCLTGNQFLLF